MCIFNYYTFEVDIRAEFWKRKTFTSQSPNSFHTKLGNSKLVDH